MSSSDSRIVSTSNLDTQSSTQASNKPLIPSTKRIEADDKETKTYGSGASSPISTSVNIETSSTISDFRRFLLSKVEILAKLKLFVEEKSLYEQQILKVLDYVELLRRLEVVNIEPVFNVTGLENVIIDDNLRESLRQEEALQNASAKKNGFFVTRGVFEE